MGSLPWGMIPDYAYVTNNHIFYTGSYDGHVYAWDGTTGKQVWKSDYYGAEDESIYGTQPFNGRIVGADGVLYVSTNTVYSLMPRTRFPAVVAINETTGQFLWKLPIGAMRRSMADGYLVATDGENGMQYTIGKGKTQTTLVPSIDAISAGTGVLIQGTIMDMSPGNQTHPQSQMPI
jgi:outer membrane protein assembly factor BamB